MTYKHPGYNVYKNTGHTPNTGYRYILEPYKTPASRYTCPGCGKHRQLTRYIETETHQHLAGHVGKCNRAVKCGYHYTPKQYFESNSNANSKVKTQNLKTTRITANTANTSEKIVSYIHPSLVDKALAHNDDNHLLRYLCVVTHSDKVLELWYYYRIGTSKHWPGSTVFWQIDVHNKIRGGKIMLYDRATGKRVKQPFNHITWVHTVLGLKTYHLEQCLFGEHLLNNAPGKRVAIVESEKTALIGHLYDPSYIWLASGGLGNLTASKCRVLQGRSITLFPDQGCYAAWCAKATELKPLLHYIQVSDLVERCAVQGTLKPGADIGDYFLQFEWKTFGVKSE